MKPANAMARRAVAAAIVLAAASSGTSAFAYCRTTTCDVENEDPETCTGAVDADGCTIDGHPVFWPGGCTWFGVQKDGSLEEHITYDQFHPVVTKAFEKWAQADCPGGGHPSFDFQDTDELYGKAECGQHEFDQHHANANVWMFRDSDWPYVDRYATIALTTVTVEIDSGRILDADVEINSWGTDISTSEANVTADLESIVTHETGHFLGLAHSLDETATMFANYSPANGLSIRSLAPDDIAGICSIYEPSSGAPTCGEPEQRFGFSRFCDGANPSTLPAEPQSKTAGGCSCSTTRSDPAGFVLVAGAVSAALVGRRRRRRSG